MLPEQPETIVEHRCRPLQAALAHEACRELECQSHPVETLTRPRHDRDIRRREITAPPARRRALEKHLHGGKGLDGLDAHVRRLGRGLQWSEAVNSFALHAKS